MSLITRYLAQINHLCDEPELFVLISCVIRVLIDSVVRPQNNSALQCPSSLDYLRLCCNSPFNLHCSEIGESHSAMKCRKRLMRRGNPRREKVCVAFITD